MFRTFSSVFTVLTGVVVSTCSASAWAEPTVVNTAVLPIPSTEAPTAAAAAEKPAEGPKTAPPRNDGASFQFELGGLIPFGQSVKGVAASDLITAAKTAEIRLAVYPTRHVGVGVGIALDSYGTDCDASAKCSAIGYRAPLFVEYAFDTRLRGPFVSGGLNLLSGYSVTSEAGNLSLRGHMKEAELGVGWRFPIFGSRSAFVPRLAFLVGEYDDMTARVGRRSFDDSIPSEERSLHFGLGIFAGYHFGS